MELQGDESSHLYHLSQQGRAYATHDADIKQLRDMLLDTDHVLERARSPMCAPQKPEGDAHGAGNKEI